MRARLLAIALVAHGLAHAWPGSAAVAAGATWVTTTPPGGSMTVRWLAAVLWTFAMAGFVAAGLGCLGLPALRRSWRPLAATAAIASLALLLGFRIDAIAGAGVLIDLLVLGALALGGAPLDGPVPVRPHGLRRTRAAARVAAWLFVLWLGVVAVSSPWHRYWGSTPAELAARLPGDAPLRGGPTFWIQHATTIHAPADAVWPWLAQLGTDRGGFYSISWLENLFGVPVHNADRIHPEWQAVQPGGFVLATRPGWLGVDHPLGWTLGTVEPGRVLVLEQWGAFVLQPIDSNTTRFIVRTRGDQRPTPLAFALAWLSLITFEPAHFTMERAMLLGVKDRAERTGP